MAREVEVYPTTTRGNAATLPLWESALVYTPAPSGSTSLVQIENEPRPLIPERELLPNEQYRFHFDMRKCIGCKCCVVACNEQNGNPAAINWRRVGEIDLGGRAKPANEGRVKTGQRGMYSGH
ncbi:MAG: hypothetical protein ACLQDA_01395 [Terracidiphilus sp.]